MPTTPPAFTPYEPRRLTYLGLREHAGYRVKAYSIVFDDGPPQTDQFEAAWPLALAELPQPAIAKGRSGVGFAILHRGRTADYFILGWWDQENELPLRAFVRDAEGWRLARGSESVCVWDLRVIWWEREAYVRTMLTNRPADVEAYLAATTEGLA